METNQQTSNDESLDAALAYANAGVSIFPTKSHSPKLPESGINGGFKDATTNNGIIRDWWSHYQDPNIGGVIPDWAVIVDIDTQAGLDALRFHQFELPATLSARTGKGGHHFWYRIPNKVISKRMIGFLPGVDILTNGFVVLPPSKGVTGTYRWKGQFDLNAVADAPGWLLTAFEFESRFRDKIDPDKVLDGVAEGERNNQIFRYGCKLRNTPGMTSKEAQILLEAAGAACSPPMKKSELHGMAKRIWATYDASETTTISEAPRVYSLAELATMNLPAPRYMVWEDSGRGVLPSGVWVLSSPPKAGKSALIANIGAAIAYGKDLWGYKTERAGVLHLDLEQDLSFGKDRWDNILLGDSPSNIHLVTDWAPMDVGGLDHLKEFLGNHPDVRFVIIDTLGDFWPREEPAGGTAYIRDKKIMAQINRLSKDTDCTIVLVHHDRKDTSGSESNMMLKPSGSAAIPGGAAVVLSLQRDDGSEIATLKVKGKNMPERTLTLRFYDDELRWELIGK